MVFTGKYGNINFIIKITYIKSQYVYIGCILIMIVQNEWHNFHVNVNYYKITDATEVGFTLIAEEIFFQDFYHRNVRYKNF